MIFAITVAMLAGADICPNAQTTAEIVECTSSEYRIADQVMTGQWRLAVARAKNAYAAALSRKAAGGYFASLLDSQRKWIAFRDAECLVESYSMRGGSGEGYSRSICLIKLTNDRTRQLKDLEF